MWIHLLTLGLINGASEVGTQPPAVVSEQPSAGGRSPFSKASRRKVIRYSDFETREAYEAAFKQAIPMAAVNPIQTIERTVSTEAEEREEDDTEMVFLVLRELMH